MKRLDLLKKEREQIHNMQCLSFNLIEECEKYYNHEIECILRYNSPNPEVTDGPKSTDN